MAFKEYIYGKTDLTKFSFVEKISYYFVERKKVSLMDKALFYQLFATLINAGVSTVKAINILKERAQNEKFFRVLATIYLDLEAGESFSKSLEKFPEIFSNAEIGIIATGEATGSLEQSLRRLHGQTERKAKVIADLKSALTYPAMIAVVLVISTVVMSTFVIPEINNLYVENGLKVSGLTALLIGFSNVMRNYWLVILALIMAVYTAFRIYVGSINGRINFDSYVLELPFIGDIIRKYNIAEFASTFGVLMESGIPLEKALKIVAKGLSHTLYKNKVYELIGRTVTGEQISKVLSESPDLFPGNVTQILEIGEKSANLGNLSLKIADQYDEELRYGLKNINTVIGPLVIVIVAVFVVLFALAILLPIFNLTQNVGA